MSMAKPNMSIRSDFLLQSVASPLVDVVKQEMSFILTLGKCSVLSHTIEIRQYALDTPVYGKTLANLARDLYRRAYVTVNYQNVRIY